VRRNCWLPPKCRVNNPHAKNPLSRRGKRVVENYNGPKKVELPEIRRRKGKRTSKERRGGKRIMFILQPKAGKEEKH